MTIRKFYLLLICLLSFQLFLLAQTPAKLKELTTNITAHFANNVHFSKDGNYFVVVVGFNADVYKKQDGGFRLLQTIKGGTWQCYNGGISEDGSFVCFSNYESTYLYKRDGETYSYFQTIDHPGKSVNKDLVMRFTGNNKLMIVGGPGNIRYYELGSSIFNEVKKVTNPDNLVFQYAALSTSGQLMVTIDVNGDVHCWQIANDNAVKGSKLLNTNKYTGMVDITDDLLLVAGTDDSLNIYKVAADLNSLTHFYGFEKDKFGEVCFNPDGNRIMVANQSSKLSVYKIEKNSVSLESINGRSSDNFTSLRMSNDAKFIAASSSGGKTISFFEAPERIMPVKAAKKTSPSKPAVGKSGTPKVAATAKLPATAPKTNAVTKGPRVHIIPGKKSNGKYVLMDSLTMKQYGEGEYQETGRTKNNLVYMYKNWHYGIMRKNGEMIVDPDTSKYIRIEEELDSAGNYLAIFYDANTSNKFGGYILLNKQYKPITSRSYGIIADYEDGYYRVNRDFPGRSEKSFYGLVNKSGKEVLKPEYKLIRNYPKEKFILTYTHDNKEGLYDYTGKQLLPDDYDDINSFDIEGKGLITVKKDGLTGLMGRTGKMVVPLKYNSISIRDYGKDSYYEVKLDGKIGTVNLLGKEMIAPQYKSLYPEFEQGCPFFNASKDDINNGWIDKTGKVLLPFIYKEGGISCPGKEGIGRGQISDSSFVFVNMQGQQVFGKKYRYASGFQHGFAYVQEKEKYGIINNKGAYVVQPVYDNISEVSGDDYYRLLYSVKQDGKWGFLDKDGKSLVPPTYDEGYDYSEGLIGVKHNGKWGFIDKNGKVIIPIMYESVSNFREGKATVSLNGVEININKKGEKIQ